MTRPADMSRVIVERRPLPRRPNLEVMVQDAIHIVAADRLTHDAQSAVERALEAADAHRGDASAHDVHWALYRRLRDVLGIKAAAPLPRKHKRPKDKAEALFGKADPA